MNDSVAPGTVLSNTPTVTSSAPDAFPANNSDTETTTTADLTPPAAPVVVSPADGASMNDNTPTIAGTAEANATVRVYSGATLLGSTTADGAGNWSLTPAAALPEGTYSFRAMARDAAGNTGPASNSVSATIDTTRPMATIALADTALTAGETALVTVTFSEAVSGFTDQDLVVEGGTLSTVSSADGGRTWTATFALRVAWRTPAT